MTRHPFSVLLERKFLEWQIEIGQRKSQAEFSKLIGVSRAAFTMWLNGDHLPDRENAGKLASYLGPEIYDALELPRPNPYLQKLSRMWENIPPDKQQLLVEDAERYEVRKDARSKKPSKQRKASTT